MAWIHCNTLSDVCVKVPIYGPIFLPEVALSNNCPLNACPTGQIRPNLLSSQSTMFKQEFWGEKIVALHETSDKTMIIGTAKM